MALVEGADGHEAAALGDGPRPHAAPAPAQLIECGLYAGVEHGMGLSVEREAPLELSHAQIPRAVRHEKRDGGAGASVVKRVGILDVADGMAPRAARVEHGLRLLRRERAEPHAHPSLLSSLCPHYPNFRLL